MSLVPANIPFFFILIPAKKIFIATLANIQLFAFGI